MGVNSRNDIYIYDMYDKIHLVRDSLMKLSFKFPKNVRHYVVLSLQCIGRRPICVYGINAGHRLSRTEASNRVSKRRLKRRDGCIRPMLG